MKTYTIDKDDLIEEIIKQCPVCFIGMIEPDGSPYVLPMNFGYHNGSFYLHSGPEGKKTEIISRQNQLCISLSTGHDLIYQHPDVACSYSMVSKSIVCKGLAEPIEDPDKKAEAMDIIMRHYTKRRFTYSLPAINNVKVWRVIPKEITCKSFGNSVKQTRYQ